MIVLKSTSDLKNVFDKLIQTMKVKVDFDGLFVVVDNFFVVHGPERSLVFNLDTKKVGTNILELDIQKQPVQEIAGNTVLVNAINMLLYVFGKWESIKGLKVEKSYEQLNALFKNILKDASVEPDYTKDYYHFYNEGIRLSYEDVINAVLITEVMSVISTEEEKEEATGLWHSMKWKMAKSKFPQVHVSDEERNQRIGDNYYISGYACDKCGGKLHMAVYPQGKEFEIDTEEGSVRLARIATCPPCRKFITPRPFMLLADGDVYVLDFEEDEAAYADYKELSGKNAAKVSNTSFNRYVDESRNVQEQPEEENGVDYDALEGDRFAELDDEIENKTPESEEAKRAEDGVGKSGEALDKSAAYEDKNGNLDNAVKAIGKEKKAEGAFKSNTTEKDIYEEPYKVDPEIKSDKSAQNNDSQTQKNPTKEGYKIQEESNLNPELSESASPKKKIKNILERMQGDKASKSDEEDDSHISDEEKTITDTVEDSSLKDEPEVIQKYEARIAQFEKLSERQITELEKQLEKENGLSPKTRTEMVVRLAGLKQEKNAKEIRQKLEASEGKNYSILSRLENDIQSTNLANAARTEFMTRIKGMKKAQGEKEAEALMAKLPSQPDRKTLESYKEKLGEYKEADTTEYLQKIDGLREKAERKDAEDLVKHARKTNRMELTDLRKQIENQRFMKGVEEEYLERVDEAIEKTDRLRLESACENMNEMTGEELEALYQDISEGMFLPKLKDDALGRVEKKLARIKTDECELLAGRFRKELSESKVSDNGRHYFYPARKVLQNEPDEVSKLMDYAKEIYAPGIRKFEYPVFMVDSSRGNTGREGMMITPEKIYYSGFMSCSSIPVEDIKEISANSGFFGKGIFAVTASGKYKLPYEVSGKDMKGYAQALHKFVEYLKERPFSRKENYLAKEKHETICCFRCGFVYKGGQESCPKCGYKSNK